MASSLSGVMAIFFGSAFDTFLFFGNIGLSYKTFGLLSRLIFKPQPYIPPPKGQYHGLEEDLRWLWSHRDTLLHGASMIVYVAAHDNPYFGKAPDWQCQLYATLSVGGVLVGLYSVKLAWRLMTNFDLWKRFSTSIVRFVHGCLGDTVSTTHEQAQASVRKEGDC